MALSLPSRPNLRFLKTLAKDTLEKSRSGDPASLDILRHHPKYTDEHAFTLQQTQHALARAYGFGNWDALLEAVRGNAPVPGKQYIEDRGLTLSYIRRPGPARTVFMLPARTCSAQYSWKTVEGWIDPRLDVVVPDRRGQGGASAPPSGYTNADMAADAVRLADELGIERFAVCGIHVALSTAAYHSDRVERLQLAAWWQLDGKLQHGHLSRKIPRRRQEYAERVSRPVAEIEQELREQHPELEGDHVRMLAESQQQVHPNVAETFADDFTLARWKAVLRQVRCPVLVTGRNAAQIREFCETEVADCRAVDVDWLGPSADPVAYVKVVNEFLVG